MNNNNEYVQCKVRLNRQNLIYISQWLRNNAKYCSSYNQEQYYFRKVETLDLQKSIEDKILSQFLIISMSKHENKIKFGYYNQSREPKLSMGQNSQEYQLSKSMAQTYIQKLPSMGFQNITIVKKTKDCYEKDGIEIEIDKSCSLDNNALFRIKNVIYNSKDYERQRLLRFINNINLKNIDTSSISGNWIRNNDINRNYRI